MNPAFALHIEPAADAAPTSTSAHRLDIEAAIVAACGRIAPLWPLKHFVAVNPFLGFSDRSFGAACATLRRVARVDMLMPRVFYREAVLSGLVEEQDLVAALAAMPPSTARPADIQALRRALAENSAFLGRPRAVVATVAEVLDTLAAGDRQASRTAFMIDEISKWCAAWFDEGQAAWRLPTVGLPPYPAWRASMRHDRNPEIMGIRGFRAVVAALPGDPIEAIAAVVEVLGIPARAVEDYLFRALFDIGGWAAYARYRGWNNVLDRREDDTLVQLLAIRVVWGYAMFHQRDDEAFRTAWRLAMEAAAALPTDDRLGDDPDLVVDLVLQQAYEGAYQRRLLARLAEHAVGPPELRRSVHPFKPPSASTSAPSYSAVRSKRSARMPRPSASQASSGSRSNTCRLDAPQGRLDARFCSSPPSWSARRWRAHLNATRPGSRTSG